MTLWEWDEPLDVDKILNLNEKKIIEKVAKKVVQWHMAVPAILFIESVKPLNFIGSQILVFFSPIVQSIFTIVDYDKFTAMMEDRRKVELFLREIEKQEAERSAKPE